MKAGPKLLSTFLFILLIVGCKKESNTATCTEANLQAKATAMTNAYTAYSTDPSRVSCLAAVNAYEAYINTAANCPGVSRTAIDDLRDDLADLRADCR